MCYISTNCSAFQEGAFLGKPSSALRRRYLSNPRRDGVDGVKVVHLGSQHALLNVLAVGNCMSRSVTGVYMYIYVLNFYNTTSQIDVMI